MRKFLLPKIVLSMFVFTTSVATVYARDEMNGFGNPPDNIEEENREKNQNKLQDLEVNSLEEISPMSYSTEERYLSVPVYAQDTDYYCGPACIQMVAMQRTGSYFYQNYIADNVGTTPSIGTYVFRMAKGLNYWCSDSFYSYETIDKTPIETAVKSSVNQNYPVVANVMTKTLDSNYSFNSEHYVVISGYRYYWAGTPVYSSMNEGISLYGVQPWSSTFTYNDPYWGAQKTVPVATMRNAIKANAGYFIW